MVGSLTVDISYGMDIDQRNDPILEIAEKGIESSLEIVNAGAYLGMLLHCLTYACSLSLHTWD